MIMNSEYVRIWKTGVVSYLQVLLGYPPGD
jgi:hypothetical protein